MQHRSLVIALLGAIIICLGIFAIFGLPIVVMRVIYSQLKLLPDTEAYDLWKDIPLPIYQRFYFFNVTNNVEIERNGAKPNLVEVGPYTYESKWYKTNINYHPNGTVSFNEIKTYHFVREKSSGDENDTIFTINGPLAVTLSLLQNAPTAVRIVVTLALDAATEGFFIKRHIRQLLFEGYPDLLTTFGPLLNPKIPSNYKGRFGWLYSRNGTSDGTFNVHTGKDDINIVNTIDNYKGMNRLPYWSNNECNSLNDSTNGEIFPPEKVKGDSIYLFYTDFCRKWKLNFNGTYETRDGITAKRYLPDSTLFKNEIDYPPNACFISKLPQPQPSLLSMSSRSSRQKKVRFPSGVFDLSACKYGAPVFLSYPHFLDADPQFGAKVNGLSPNQSKHMFFLGVEPVTGTTVELSGRIQINVFINKPPGLFRYRNVPDIVFPVFWQELNTELTEKFSNHLKWVIKQPMLISSISSASILTIGIILIIVSMLFPLYKRYMHETEKKNSGSVCDSDKNDNSQDYDKNEIIAQNAAPRPSAPMGVLNPGMDPN